MKEKNVINYYITCNRLKNIIRTGWTDWNVSKERLESVAEHVYSTCMLAIAMKSEYQYDIDIMKVIYMLAIHELGETVIGDLTLFDISKEEKEELEHKAVHQVLDNLIDGDYIEELFLEFDSHKTKEAMFAYQCDKLECDLQAKLYDEEGYVDLSKQDNNKSFYDKDVQELINEGMTFGQMWITFGQRRYPYDDNFKAVSNYALNNRISEERLDG
jgi:putative hydrolase of HD superfamily